MSEKTYTLNELVDEFYEELYKEDPFLLGKDEFSRRLKEFVRNVYVGGMRRLFLETSKILSENELTGDCSSSLKDIQDFVNKIELGELIDTAKVKGPELEKLEFQFSLGIDQSNNIIFKFTQPITEFGVDVSGAERIVYLLSKKIQEVKTIEEK